MITKKQFDSIFIPIILIIIIGMIVYRLDREDKQKTEESTNEVVVKHDSISYSSLNPKDYLMLVLIEKNIKFPEIVYAQAVLETGDFTSTLCIKHHNLFGLYNSKKQEFFHFNNWEESVDAYIKYIEYKYISGDYFEFLDSIGYAEDPNYIKKLKIILNE